MPYGLAVSAVLLCSLLLLSSMVLAFFLALPVVVVMAIAVSLLSRRTPRSARLTRLKRRDRGVLTETLTWNRNLLYL
jgi:membrane protein implicated in regulation of membrane protease activity